MANYYPFGMMEPGRQWAVDSSLFGYNDKEKTDEITGRGNSYDFGERMYDARVSRFWSLDPLNKTFPQQSPYLSSYDNPISAIDLNGTTSFFIMGTLQNLERTRNSRLRESVNYLHQTLSTSTGAVNYGFDWSDHNGLLNNISDRKLAAERLAQYVIDNNKPGDDITLIGYSYGGDVAEQASGIIGKRTGQKVNLISIAAPASNAKRTHESYKNSTSAEAKLIYDEEVHETSENPEYNSFINDMIQLWLDDDGVSTAPLGRDHTFDSPKVRNYMIDDGGKDWGEDAPWYVPNFISAHGFIYYPDMIKKTVEEQKIAPLKSINEGKNETKDK